MPHPVQPPNFLDFLPIEICERLSHHLSHGEATPTAANLAETTSKQRQAVLASICHSLPLSNFNFRQNARWISIYNGEARELRVGTRTLLGQDTWSGQLFDAIENGNFEMVNIVEDSRSVPTLGGRFLESWGRSAVQELQYMVQRKSAHALLVQMLSCHRVKRLEVSCFASSVENCVLRNSDISQGIRENCADIEVLNVSCSCAGGKEFDLISMFGGGENLKEIGFNVKVSNAELDKMKTLEKVRVKHPVKAYTYGLTLGECVTAIESKVVVLEAVDVERLAKCPRLECLTVGLQEQAEWALKGLGRNCENLRELVLHWWKTDRVGYVTVGAGTVKRMVEGASNLEKLHLADVVIPVAEMVEILSIAGAKLRSFESSVGFQQELPFERLEVLIYACASYCPSLTNFSVSDATLSSFAGMTQMTPRLLKAIAFLQKRAPLVKARRVKYLLTGQLSLGD